MSTPSQALAGTQPVTVSGIQPVTPSKILMIAPTGGESALVPPDQVDSYIAKGAKVGVRMTAPDGKQKAIVPFDQQDQYQKQGATWDVHPDNDSAKNYLQAQASAKPLKDLSDHNRYMVSAMTGQGKDFSQDPTLSPEERQQAEAGRKAGTIQGGVDIAAGAIGGAVAPAISAAASGAGRVGSAALKPLVEAIAEEVPYLKSSPVLYLEHVAEQAVKYVIANPGKVITGSGVLGATAKYLLSKATP